MDSAIPTSQRLCLAAMAVSHLHQTFGRSQWRRCLDATRRQLLKQNHHRRFTERRSIRFEESRHTSSSAPNERAGAVDSLLTDLRFAAHFRELRLGLMLTTPPVLRWWVCTFCIEFSGPRCLDGTSHDGTILFVLAKKNTRLTTSTKARPLRPVPCKCQWSAPSSTNVNGVALRQRAWDQGKKAGNGRGGVDSRVPAGGWVPLGWSCSRQPWHKENAGRRR